MESYIQLWFESNKGKEISSQIFFKTFYFMFCIYLDLFYYYFVCMDVLHHICV